MENISRKIIRMATWNIGGGYIAKKDSLTYSQENISYFANVIKEYNIDVICLQEAHVSKEFNQSSWIADQLGFNYVFGIYDSSHLQEECELSVAILSRWPLLDSHLLMLPNPNLTLIINGHKELCHNKAFIISSINVDDSLIKVASGHLFPFHRFGYNFSDLLFTELRHFIESQFLQKNTQAFIGADMNCSNLCDILPKLFTRYHSAYFDHTRPDGRITDYIIYASKHKLIKKIVLPTITDHYLLITDFQITHQKHEPDTKEEK